MIYSEKTMSSAARVSRRDHGAEPKVDPRTRRLPKIGFPLGEIDHRFGKRIFPEVVTYG